MLRNVERPDWAPLIELAPEHLGDFMWMFAVELEDGTCVQAYKHRGSRSYLWLDNDGHAFFEVAEQRYEEAAVDSALLAAIEASAAEVRYSFAPQNDQQEIQLSWARSATKHRIARGRSGFVVKHCGLRFAGALFRSQRGRADDRVAFFGDDETGTALEVFAVELGRESFLVIHAMELRSRHRELYERSSLWRR